MENTKEDLVFSILPQALIIVGSLTLIYTSIFVLDPSSTLGTVIGWTGMICLGFIIYYHYKNKQEV